MPPRSYGAAKDRNRLDLICQAPPCFTRADIADILSCCVSPPPTTSIIITDSETGDDPSRLSSIELNRSDALAHLLTATLNEFLVDRALEADPAQANVVARFRLICDAAQRLQRVLGMQSGEVLPYLTWPIERGLLYPMMRTSRAMVTRAGRSAPKKYDVSRSYLALLNQCRKDLSIAVAGINSVARWSAAASRIEKFQGVRSRRSRDDVLDRFISTLGHIWTDVLGQDLEVVTNSTRNSGRWAPIPDSLNHFITFVGKCAKPLGVQFQREDLMSRAVRLLRRNASTRPRA